MIEIYVDGSCSGNGKDTNIGGFGIAVLVPDKSSLNGYRLDYHKKEKHYDTTNNRMELEALIHGIELALNKYKDNKCIIYSDSSYCVNICKDWIWAWSQNGWKNSKKEIVENIDLIYKLFVKLKKEDFPNYIIKKVAGHSNTIGNDLADALAKNDDNKFAKILKENDLVYGIEKKFD